jgi:hypothetical protein
MKQTTVISLLALAVIATVAITAPNAKHRFTALPVVHAQSGCSTATLSGDYGFIFQGFDTLRAGANSVPFAGAGVMAFDGAGDVSISFATALNGKISTGATGTGTYTINSDCTGTASFTTGDAAGETLNLVIVGGGREALGMSTLNTQTFTIDAKQQ